MSHRILKCWLFVKLVQKLLRNYLKQIREETSGRLLSVAYRPNGTPNKWWLAFAKRKFMNNIAS
ncbi:Actin-related protein 2/3 complex subunit 3 - like 1 [Theobroma cacao]|nr:Actin-related protein 2/3 complex subunit 3 - like 1 [Theobroma cacao]